MGTNTQYLNTSIRRQYSKTGQTRFSKYPKTSIRILVQILVSGGCQTGPKPPDRAGHAYPEGYYTSQDLLAKGGGL